ncbi:MAG: hypothetical protein QM733_06380 [Ilumatobacteraceae bacterium]
MRRLHRGLAAAIAAAVLLATGCADDAERASPTTEPPTTVGLAADQQPETADELRAFLAALQPVLAGSGRICDRWWFTTPVGDTARAESVTQISERLHSEISTSFPVGVTFGNITTNVGAGAALGSGRLVAAWCVYGM